MSTRTCKFCGWPYPRSHVGTLCKICGQQFDERYCSVCDSLLPVSSFEVGRSVCKKCRRPQQNESKRRHAKKLDAQFDEWLEKVRSVPKSYPTLTEEQWLAACRHFDGCARCHNKVIDARGFLISAKLGGRYCDWNVIPLCERCANTWDLDFSLFRQAELRDYTKRSHEYRECLAKIVEYLGEKLDEATRTTE